MDDVNDQLVKDVVELKQQVVGLGTQITEGRVREIVKEELAATAPPLKTSKKRPFGLSSRANKSQTPNKA